MNDGIEREGDAMNNNDGGTGKHRTMVGIMWAIAGAGLGVVVSRIVEGAIPVGADLFWRPIQCGFIGAVLAMVYWLNGDGDAKGT